jgi:hypothetical protein
MWKKDEKKLLKIKKNKKSGRARFSGTGGDDHQLLFFMWPYIYCVNQFVFLLHMHKYRFLLYGKANFLLFTSPKVQ